MSVEPDQNPGSQSAIAITLLRWYDDHARPLPWRALPGANASDPYRVWLSEIMLQQTTVAAVIPYFQKFLGLWPTVGALAHARDEAVMAAWAGLGYYARARNLLACARQVAGPLGGQFPDHEDGLRALPGVGAYTAAAIAAIAFGKRAVVVDANVERVVARLFAIETPLPAARPAIREKTDRITPSARAGDFAQAMMDMGAGICSARQPDCLACPVQSECRAFALGRAAELPIKSPKKAKPQRTGTAWWIERDGHVWLVKRPSTGMLGGMMALPDDGWRARADGDGRPPENVADDTHLGEVSHVFSHFALQLAVRSGAFPTNMSMHKAGTGQWWAIDKLESAGLPTLFAKAARIGRKPRIV